MSENQKPRELESCQVITIRPADSTELAEPNPRLPVRALQRVGMFVASCYDPKPMVVPEVVEDFDALPAVVRVAEVCRYQWNEMLYRVSHRGGIQAFWKLCFASMCIFIPAVIVLYLLGMGIAYLLIPLEFASLTLQRIAFQLASIAGLAAGVVILYSVCIIVLKGIGVVAKNPLVTGIFTVVVLIALLTAGIAYGLAWLEFRFPVTSGWLKWLSGG